MRKHTRARRNYETSSSVSLVVQECLRLRWSLRQELLCIYGLVAAKWNEYLQSFRLAVMKLRVLLLMKSQAMVSHPPRTHRHACTMSCGIGDWTSRHRAALSNPIPILSRSGTEECQASAPYIHSLDHGDCTLPWTRYHASCLAILFAMRPRITYPSYRPDDLT
jgi:hypothetical protein